MKYIKILALITCTIMINACKSKKDMIQESVDPIKIFGLQRGACFGTCPVYTLSIYNNGDAIYEGTRYTRKDGKHRKKLDKSTLDKLAQAFAEARYFDMQEKYESRIPDLPLTKLYHNNGSQAQYVQGKETLPQKAVELATLLDKVADEDGWVANSPKKVNMTRAIQKQYVKVKEIDEERINYNLVVIETHDNVFLPKWLKSKKNIGISLVEKDINAPNTYIITYDRNKLRSSQILEILRSDDEIKKAYFKKVSGPTDR